MYVQCTLHSACFIRLPISIGSFKDLTVIKIFFNLFSLRSELLCGIVYLENLISISNVGAYKYEFHCLIPQSKFSTAWKKINLLIYITSIVLTFEQNVLDFIQYCHYLFIFFNSLKYYLKYLVSN